MASNSNLEEKNNSNANSKQSHVQNSKIAVIGTTNQLKIDAVNSVLKDYGYVACGIDKYESKVSEYPNGRKETQLGALYRAQHCQKNFSDSHLWIGVESGFIDKNGNKFASDDDRNWPEPIFVIIAIVIIANETINQTILKLFKNNDNNNVIIDDKNKNKQSKQITFWSEILQCPITKKQRFNQIANAFSSNLKELSKDNDQHS